MLKILSVLSLVFCASLMLSAQTVPDSVSQVQGYLIGPGDEISAKVLDEPQFDFSATVDQDGRIEIPFFDDPVMAKCKTERDLRSDVAKVLKKYLRNPQVNLRVTERKSRPPATIYGEVRTPQQVVITRPSRLMELISFSGGVNEEAGGSIQIFRTYISPCGETDAADNWSKDSADLLEVPSRVFSLNSLRAGEDEANPRILPGDVVVVQKAPPVYITGEVLTPQGVFLKEDGLTLTEAIAKIGGLRPEAKTKDIKIYRLKPNSKEREVISANYDLIQDGKQKDVLLRPYDIVEVDKAKKSIAQTVLELATGTARATIGGFGNTLPTRVLY